jgi:hypothetical protein
MDKFFSEHKNGERDKNGECDRKRECDKIGEHQIVKGRQKEEKIQIMK